MLGVRFIVQCANEGCTPVLLNIADDVKWSVVHQDTFAARNMWSIGERLILTAGSVNASNNRHFPSVNIAFRVARQPFYYMMNVCVPSALFSLLAIAMMGLPVNYPPSRLTYLLAVTLTVVTYKLWLGDKLPAVTYLSLLDKYQLWCAAIIICIDFETAVQGSIMDVTDIGYPWTDRYFMIVAAACWIVLHLWFGHIAWHEHYRFNWIAKNARKYGLGDASSTNVLTLKEQFHRSSNHRSCTDRRRTRRPSDTYKEEHAKTLQRCTVSPTGPEQASGSVHQTKPSDTYKEEQAKKTKRFSVKANNSAATLVQEHRRENLVHRLSTQMFWPQSKAAGPETNQSIESKVC